MGRKAGLATAWKKARETTKEDQGFGEAVPLDKGSYLFQLVRGECVDTGRGRLLLLTFATIDEEDRGALCKLFEGPIDDPERVVWVQRTLKRLGVEDDVLDAIEDEDDLLEAINELVEAFAVVKARIVEKDGYKNIKLGGPADVEDDDLFDPKEALKGGDEGGSGDKPKKPKKPKKGEEPDEEEEEEDEEDEGYEEGDEVTVDYDGEPFGATITAVNEDGTYDVEYEDGATEEGVDAERFLDDEGEEEGEEPEEEEELAVGDEVVVDVKGKEKKGVVKKIDGDEVSVKVAGEKKLVVVARDDLDFEVDEE